MNVAESLIEACARSEKTILFLGDGMTDVYVHGYIDDCQDGCKKFVETEHVEVPGGCANAARSLQNWECHRVVLHDRNTGPVKTRFLIDDKVVWRHDWERAGFDKGLWRMQALDALIKRNPHAVLLSDYDKGTMTPEFIAQVIDHCRKRKIPCVADVKREPKCYRGAIIKCNEGYLNYYADFLPRKSTVVTCGSRNPILWHNDAPYGLGHDLPEVKCVNHVGAGDCFAAHLTLALAHRLSLRDAVALAHSAGRVYVQNRHNSPPEPLTVTLDLPR